MYCTARSYIEKIFFSVAFLSIIACNEKNNSSKKEEQNPPIIYVQPLGNCNSDLLRLLQTSIHDILQVPVNLSLPAALPQNAWYAPRHRYWADSILIMLHPIHPQQNTYTIGVTEEDISTKKDVQPNWGVMGLGFQPGNCCVVSTYRLYRYPQTQKQLLVKLLKVALHEIGHNFGLPHCANSSCIMADAKGKDKLDNEKDFCPSCRKMLAAKGLQPTIINWF